MCGIFGFITKDGRGPDLARLRRIAVGNATTGPPRVRTGVAWRPTGPSIPSSARAPPRPTWATWTPAAARRW